LSDDEYRAIRTIRFGGDGFFLRRSCGRQSMPDFPRHLEVHGLFGHLDPSVKLRLPERITILTGPNGSGKTHILRLLRHLVAPDVAAVARLPFNAVELEYESGKSLSVVRISGNDVTEITVSGALSNGKSFEAAYTVTFDSLEGISLPDFIQRVDEEVWIDMRDDEILSVDEVIDRFGRPGRRTSPEPTVSPLGGGQGGRRGRPGPEWPPQWIREHFASAAAPTFIATARLDLTASPDEAARFRTGRPRLRQPGTAARIRQYVDRVRGEVAEARRASLAVSQRADQGFASRALDKAHETVKDRELQERYEHLVKLHQELHANGLTAESLGVSFPGKTNPTERRILDVFLGDWEDKLRPLIPVHQKLQLLREIVGEKMRGKLLRVENGEPSFTSLSGDPISVEMLSSGEQHLLALFTMLLFAAAPGAVVLIDEPEISLHAAWKHAFLDDIARVAELNDLQVVLATHSTAIINGRWELVEELENSA
jgi:ABC-type transport system involved in cytochrome c biogenesis ATPase subunit